MPPRPTLTFKEQNSMGNVMVPRIVLLDEEAELALRELLHYRETKRASELAEKARIALRMMKQEAERLRMATGRDRKLHAAVMLRLNRHGDVLTQLLVEIGLDSTNDRGGSVLLPWGLPRIGPQLTRSELRHFSPATGWASDAAVKREAEERKAVEAIRAEVVALV